MAVVEEGRGDGGVVREEQRSGRAGVGDGDAEGVEGLAGMEEGLEVREGDEGLVEFGAVGGGHGEQGGVVRAEGMVEEVKGALGLAEVAARVGMILFDCDDG